MNDLIDGSWVSGKFAPSKGAAQHRIPWPLELVHFSVTGMKSEDCVRRVEEKLMESEGVERALVELDSGRVTVEYDPRSIDPERLRSVLKDSGFEARDRVNGVT